jgi:hypothetical protein
MGDGEAKRSSVEYDDWMNDSDALMWHIERDPLLRSTVLSVWLLDRTPDPALFENALARTRHLVPRLAQRVVEDPLGVSPPRWIDDPLFDPAYHVRRVRVPGEGTLRNLLDLAAPIMMQAFDKDRPLWEFYLVEGLEGGKCGVLMKIHHAMTDGVGMVRMTEGLVERTRAAGYEAVERQEERIHRHDDYDVDAEHWNAAIATAGALTASSSFDADLPDEAIDPSPGPSATRERELFRLSDASSIARQLLSIAADALPASFGVELRSSPDTRYRPPRTCSM